MIRAGRGCCGAMLVALLACAGPGEAGSQAQKADLKVLASSNVRDNIAAAAIRVAGSGNAPALGRLGKLLAAPAFLARLDDTTNPHLAFYNVGRVFSALAKSPSAATKSLCLHVAGTAAFDATSNRTSLVLEALAAVRPMSAAGATWFSVTNAQGYFLRNGMLLAANGSARAMALLDSMFADRSRTVVDRIFMSREALVPHRTELSTIRLVDTLIRRPDLEPELAQALAECLFEYRPDEWYGKRRNPPQAPPWSSAAPEARREAAALGLRLLGTRKDWPDAFRAAIRAMASDGGVGD